MIGEMKMKITIKMLDYWYGSDIALPKEVIRDIIDIANGDYKPELLKSDILVTWGGRNR